MRVALAALLIVACDDGAGSTAPTDGGPPRPDAQAPATRALINEVSAARDYIELYNAGGPVDHSGWSLVDDGFEPDDDERAEHQAMLPDGVLEPGGRLLLDDLPFGIGNEDAVRLLDAAGATRDVISWPPDAADVSWCRLPDGGAFTQCALTPDGPNGAPWAGVCGDGTLDPGEVCDGRALAGRDCLGAGLGRGALGCTADCLEIDYGGCAPREGASPMVINEVRAVGDDPIELFNQGDADVDLTDWRVAEAVFRPGDPTTADRSFLLPGPARVAPGGRVVLYRDVDHAFGLSAEDGLRLYDPSGVLADQADWLGGQAEQSFCRLPDGVGPFMACAGASFGRPNQ